MKKNSLSKNFYYNNIKIELHPEVYEPAEDTFHLLESIKIKPNKRVLEIGTGCGIIALYCASVGADVICTDVNPYAVDLTYRNYISNRSLIKGKLEVRKGDLFSSIKEHEKFDIIIFNPPYLPTKKTDLVGGSGWFDVATNGGVDGLDITKRFIEDLYKYLSDKGQAYFICSSLSKIKKIDLYLSENRLKVKIVSSYSFVDETLYVYLVFK